METATKLSVITCEGSPYSIGFAHGRKAANLIAQGISNWRSGIEKSVPNVDKYLDKFLSETGFVWTIEHHTPALFDEMQGIADGAEQPFEHILAYNLLDEEWSFRTGKLDETAPGCTVVAIRGVAMGQTMDIPTAHDGTQIVLSIQPDIGSQKLVFTAAGMIGLNGANHDGVGVVVNNLAQSPSSRTGLPVLCIFREILEYPTARKAAEWVGSVPHAVGQHYLIGDPEELISLEGAANGVFEVETGSTYAHANHPLANLTTREGAEQMELASNTHARHQCAVKLIPTARDQSGLEHVLSDREAPISRERTAGFMTFGGTSIGLTHPPRVRIAPGPPHETAWTEVAWADA